MNERGARQAAEFLWSAWQGKRLVDAVPEDYRPRDLEEGYAVQDALGALAGPAIGWKIAATSKAGQHHIGVDAPLAGPLYRCFAYASGAILPAGHLHMRVSEAEFAFRMARDLPSRGRPYEPDEVLDAVAALHLAIEVPDSRYRDFVTIGAPQLVADASCASYFVLGPEYTDFRKIDWLAHPVTMHKNGAVAALGKGSNVLGDPRVALTWIANDLALRRNGLREGEIITTGTCIVPLEIGPGDAVVADFGILGAVSVRFT
ncbi:2-keto-4-pentenoate hydratase [Pendulispora albinea]|uniref:Fumarylacetoacetate hydrolase family protein n=1 Tax=Pendulispora albinea TaxID=2741071 RepID=A0ABZ2LVW8_9BACT